MVSKLFALYTQHAWEYWFITYREGKNLALGNGLVCASLEHALRISGDEAR